MSIAHLALPSNLNAQLGTLSVSGPGAGALTVTGGAAVGGPVTLGGNAALAGGLSVTGDIAVGGRVTVNGTGVFAANVDSTSYGSVIPSADPRFYDDAGAEIPVNCIGYTAVRLARMATICFGHLAFNIGSTPTKVRCMIYDAELIPVEPEFASTFFQCTKQPAGATVTGMADHYVGWCGVKTDGGYPGAVVFTLQSCGTTASDTSPFPANSTVTIWSCPSITYRAVLMPAPVGVIPEEPEAEPEAEPRARTCAPAPAHGPKRRYDIPAADAPRARRY